MKSLILLGLMWICCVERNLLATSCAVPPPCARVRPGSVLFVGMVIDGGVPSTTSDQSPHDVLFQVNEAFAGIEPSSKEVVVTTGGSWLQKGHDYLIDATTDNHGRLYQSVCGASGELTTPSVAELLGFLRRRALGETTTTLTISVVDEFEPVSDVDVTIRGPGGPLTGRTNADGAKGFDDIKPGIYEISAARPGYHADEERSSEHTIVVLAGTCQSSLVFVKAEARVSGLVHDAKGEPVAGLQIELVTAPENPAEKISLRKSFFETYTRKDGTFSLESVSPGRYLLGTNIIGLSTSSFPPTYYPGQRSRYAAIPVEVKLGDTIDNLLFTLPDFGGTRDIQICVVDQAGQPVGGVNIESDITGQRGNDSAKLRGSLETDATGCAKSLGLTRVEYALHAIVRPMSGDIRQMQVSDSVVIESGEAPLRKVLVLGRPLGSQAPQQ